MPFSQPARRGFFFTVLALVILSFIFISITLWAQAQTAAENRAAERFRAEALQTALSMVSNETFTKFVNASALYAINKLASSLEEQPDCAKRGIPYYTGTNNAFPDGTYNVNASIYELMLYGNTSAYLYSSPFTFYPDGANLTYVGDERKYGLGNFFDQTRAAVAMLGYEVQWGEVENFTFNQTDAWTMHVHLSVQMNFTDSRGLVSISRLMEINLSVPVDGFTDPSVLRGDMQHRLDPTSQTCESSCVPNMPQRPHRNVYRGIDPGAPVRTIVYDNATDAQALLLKGGGEGLGWFFGPVSQERNTSFSFTNYHYNLTTIRSYIYMTDNAADALDQSGYFGGLIITKPAGLNITSETLGNCTYTNYTQTNCLYCISYQTVTGSPCSRPAQAHVTPESIPIDPYIPYIQTDGTPPFIAGHENFHTGLFEALIVSNNNATDLCGFAFGQANRDCRAPTADPAPLMRKFGDEGSGHSASKLWDITGPRDMAICGFYVRSDYAPSYLQRLTNFWSKPGGAPYSALNQGIESFVLGKWAGGMDDACAQVQDSGIETYSRVDYQFYSRDLTGKTCSGPYVKGLPGCKQIEHCTSNGPLVNATGRFAFCIYNTDPLNNPSPAQRYNTTNLTFVSGPGPGFEVCK